jgi:hypothetical protein
MREREGGVHGQVSISHHKAQKKIIILDSLKRPSENVAKFEYLEMTITYQNNIHKQVRNRPKLGNTSYHSVQSLFSCGLLPRNLQINVQQNSFNPTSDNLEILIIRHFKRAVPRPTV